MNFISLFVFIILVLNFPPRHPLANYHYLRSSDQVGVRRRIHGFHQLVTQNTWEWIFDQSNNPVVNSKIGYLHPETYYRKWNKPSWSKLENQLYKNNKEKFYWMTDCGALLCLLIISVIKILREIKLIILPNTYYYSWIQQDFCPTKNPTTSRHPSYFTQ